MALPAAHFAITLGLATSRDRLALAVLCLLSIVPDFDFFFVWVCGFPMEVWHRTWSHSLFFALTLALLWGLLRPRLLASISPALFFLVLAAHGLLDLFCTADAADHGVMLLWPLSDVRLGWPVLVPLYLELAESPFSLQGTLRFTMLEILLSPLLWFIAWALRNVTGRFTRVSERLAQAGS
jgi:membrane-bound metal-dependent hydrolase YbcI (DUF457 family)